ncbi:elongation factor P [Lactobacillus helveticus]|uniref:elongation factor P n=1 Tax=Lactobacillus helveticus TaxID=1587 RepID=UPI00040F7C16|nr:elongation factor P [Lactobacillus helveticus]MCT3393964.1 elongation factor P [Lactobacillus helveticus]MCT3423352.1 elongation factor P [Lactobacillus helveticus]
MRKIYLHKRFDSFINLKKGMIFSQDGKLIKVLKANHHKPGKGNTVMQMDLRDVKSGAVVHKTMRPTEKVDLVDVNKRTAQYLYGEGDVYTFMDTETYDQYEVSADQLGDDVKFLMPNIMVDMEFTGDNKIIGIELPTTVEMTVKETQPEIKGATVAGGGKPATMETGLVVQVPDFIKEGEKLIIGTENGDYKSRADSQPR